jgi:hypothetical protein
MSEETTAWFHEDDFCQMELLPAESEAFTRRQMGEVEKFAATHRAEGGGWTGMYLREDSPANFRS